VKIASELVVCKTVNPDGKVLLVEITNLMLLPTVFYDQAPPVFGLSSNEVAVVHGWLTVVAQKLYRVTEIPEYDITFPDPSKKRALYEVLVNWDDLDVKPIALEEPPNELDPALDR